METAGNDRVWDKSTKAASNCSRMDIITKSFALLFLVLMTCTMAYQLVQLTGSDDNTDKMSSQPKKLGNISIAFVNLSRKIQELDRKFEKINAIMTRNSKRMIQKLNKLYKMTAQTNPEPKEKQQKLRTIMIQNGSEPYLPYGPQYNVPLQLLTTGGWKQCFSLSFDMKLNRNSLDRLKKSCTASKILLACRMSDHSIITALAWGSRQQVLFKTSKPPNYKVKNGTGWYYYEETSTVSLLDNWVYHNRNNTTPDQLIPVTKGSIGFTPISYEFEIGSGYPHHDLSGYVNPETNDSHRIMSWRILDYPTNKLIIRFLLYEAYITGGNCGQNTHLNSRKWQRMAFEM